MKILVVMGLIFSTLTFSQTENSPKATVTPTPAIQEAAPAKAPEQQAPVVASTAYFQHGLGLGIGQTVLFGDFSDHGDDELAFDLFYQYKASYSFDFLANFHTNTYKKDDNQKTDLTGVTFNIKGKLFDYDAFAPYLTGGIGFYWPKVTRFSGANLVESENEMVLGFNAGLGADLQVSEHFSFGFASFYHQPLNVKQDSQASVNGSYLRLMAIVFIHF